MQKSFLILNYYILIYSIYCSINSQNSQQSIIQPLNISSRGYLTARQRNNTLIYNALRYQVQTDRMDNNVQKAEDSDRIGLDGRRWDKTKHPVIEG